MINKIILLIAGAFVALSSARKYSAIVREVDILQDTISNSAMKHYLINYSSNISVPCFEKQKQNFNEFGDKMDKMFNEAAKNVSQAAGIEGAAEPFKKMGLVIRALPRIFWPFLERRQFKEALEIREQIGALASGNARAIAEVLFHLDTKKPEAGNASFTLISKIHEEARRRSKIMSEAIRDCIEEASP